MSISAKDCCVLNGGAGAWAFDALAGQLSSLLGVEVATEPRRFNYVLHLENMNRLARRDVFIPIESIQLAADKRLLASRFAQCGVPVPRTQLLNTFQDVLDFIRKHPGTEWCLKYPTSCGANGHRLITAERAEPPNWPRPFVVQEFVRLAPPEVYRTYCAARELFGWVARRFPEGTQPSLWVAHARGARYAVLDDAPVAAQEAAQLALEASGLWDSFGCVDLLQKRSGEWLVLEVGTDGLVNHVDRELGADRFEQELQRRVADAFWKAARAHSW